MAGPVESQAAHLRSITSEDRVALASFSCRHFQMPWTDVVQEMVRDHLADELEYGKVTAMGLWVGQRLAGVTAWRIDQNDSSGQRICRSILLAIQDGYVRRGYGRRLKQELIEQAKKAGAASVVSMVHWDNDPMIRLNAALGARVERIDDDPDYVLCILPI